jgi:5'-phosphate synthase pdxT subunit
VKIGVLAMQGAFLEHEKVLIDLGIDVIEVRKSEDLEDIDGLVIPGGESTAIGKMMEKYGLMEIIKEKCKAGLPVFGTCAGMILLSKEVDKGLPGQPLLGALSIVADRNAFGRQIDSFEQDLSIPELGDKPFKGIFIRAPLVKKTMNGVKVLCKIGDRPVAVREGNVLATAFHPELTDDSRLHNYFIDMIKEGKIKNG